MTCSKNNNLFKVTKHTVNAKETKLVTNGCRNETNKHLVSKQGRKQITGTMICSKLAANALGLSKQNNISGICAADVEQIIIWSANNTINKITETMTCSKSTANASGQ